MTHKSRFGLTLAIVLMVGASSQILADEEEKVLKCEEGIEVAGICDPFVPGTIIQFLESKPISVISTWHNGPAENAGVCPGDQILAVNGISASQNTSTRMLREIASDSPSSIHLRLRRGNAEFDFEVPRVRESTLAKLSKRKFLWASGVEGGTRLVPLDETHEELGELEKFQARIDRVYGFKTVEGLSVPVGTPEGQLEKLSRLHLSGRIRGGTGIADSPDSYTAGFSVLLLKDPEEVWVNWVLPGSPAHRAGLFPGDKLVELDGNMMEGVTTERLKDLLSKPDARRQVYLKVIRAGSAVSLKLETQKARESSGSNSNELVPSWGQYSGDDYVVGIHALQAEDPREAIVAEVEYPSPALDAGLHPGDLLLAINGTLMKEIDRQELAKLLAPSDPSEITLKVSRIGKLMTFRITPVTYRTALAKIGRKPTKLGPAPQHCPES